MEQAQAKQTQALTRKKSNYNYPLSRRKASLSLEKFFPWCIYGKKVHQTCFSSVH